MKSQNASIVDVIAEYTGVTDITPEELAKLEVRNSFLILQIAQAAKNFPPEQDKDRLARVIGDLISSRARIGWTTWGHTGADVSREHLIVIYRIPCR